jgi:hypothetical protein
LVIQKFKKYPNSQREVTIKTGKRAIATSIPNKELARGLTMTALRGDTVNVGEATRHSKLLLSVKRLAREMH